VAEQDDVVDGDASVVVASDQQIVTIIPADAGWRAIYGQSAGEDSALSRIVAWALVEDDEGRRVVGLVVHPKDRSKIVPAEGTESPHAGTLSGYGFKER
jgi:hypothetical protein